MVFVTRSKSKRLETFRQKSKIPEFTKFEPRKKEIKLVDDQIESLSKSNIESKIPKFDAKEPVSPKIRHKKVCSVIPEMVINTDQNTTNNADPSESLSQVTGVIPETPSSKTMSTRAKKVTESTPRRSTRNSARFASESISLLSSKETPRKTQKRVNPMALIDENVDMVSSLQEASSGNEDAPSIIQISEDTAVQEAQSDFEEKLPQTLRTRRSVMKASENKIKETISKINSKDSVVNAVAGLQSPQKVPIKRTLTSRRLTRNSILKASESTVISAENFSSVNIPENNSQKSCTPMKSPTSDSSSLNSSGVENVTEDFTLRMSPEKTEAVVNSLEETSTPRRSARMTNTSAISPGKAVPLKSPEKTMDVTNSDGTHFLRKRSNITPKKVLADAGTPLKSADGSIQVKSSGRKSRNSDVGSASESSEDTIGLLTNPEKASTPMKTIEAHTTMKSPEVSTLMRSPEIITSTRTSKTNTPVSSPKVSTPVSSPKVSTPVSSPKVSTPVSSPKVSTPVSSPKVSTPVSSTKASTPMKSPEVSTPMSSPEVSTPMSSPEASTPMKSPEASTPVKSPEASTPVSSTKASTPVSSSKASTPVSSTKASTPVSSTKASTPVKSPEVSTPVSSTKASTPVSSTKASTPVKSPEVSTPISSTKASTPVSSTKASTPMKSPEVSTPMSSPKVSTPMKSPEASTPVKSPEASTPVSSTKASTPVSSTKASTPVKSPEVSTPVSSTKASTPVKSPEVSTPISSTKASTPMKSPEVSTPVSSTKVSTPVSSPESCVSLNSSEASASIKSPETPGFVVSSDSSCCSGKADISFEVPEVSVLKTKSPDKVIALVKTPEKAKDSTVDSVETHIIKTPEQTGSSNDVLVIDSEESMDCPDQMVVPESITNGISSPVKHKPVGLPIMDYDYPNIFAKRPHCTSFFPIVLPDEIKSPKKQSLDPNREKPEKAGSESANIEKSEGLPKAWSLPKKAEMEVVSVKAYVTSRATTPKEMRRERYEVMKGPHTIIPTEIIYPLRNTGDDTTSEKLETNNSEVNKTEEMKMKKQSKVKAKKRKSDSKDTNEKPPSPKKKKTSKGFLFIDSLPDSVDDANIKTLFGQNNIKVKKHMSLKAGSALVKLQDWSKVGEAVSLLSENYLGKALCINPLKDIPSNSNSPTAVKNTKSDNMADVVITEDEKNNVIVNNLPAGCKLQDLAKMFPAATSIKINSKKKCAFIKNLKESVPKAKNNKSIEKQSPVKSSPTTQKKSPEKSSPTTHKKSPEKSSPSTQKKSPVKSSPSTHKKSPEKSSPITQKKSPMKSSPTTHKKSPVTTSPNTQKESPVTTSPNTQKESPVKPKVSKKKFSESKDTSDVKTKKSRMLYIEGKFRKLTMSSLQSLFNGEILIKEDRFAVVKFEDIKTAKKYFVQLKKQNRSNSMVKVKYLSKLSDCGL
ncbi:hypothetical protein Ahia01_001112500 [Argonauta hians]